MENIQASLACGVVMLEIIRMLEHILRKQILNDAITHMNMQVKRCLDFQGMLEGHDSNNYSDHKNNTEDGAKQMRVPGNISHHRIFPFPSFHMLWHHFVVVVTRDSCILK